MKPLSFPAILCCVLLGALLPFSSLHAEEGYRTDAHPDEDLPWFQLKPGEFPPEGSAHYFSGELIAVDHVNRRGTLRVDRTDAQRRSHWDLPVEFYMLPYGTVRYHGAPAALRDIPIGTHLHGLFYVKGPDEEGTPPLFHNRASIEADFNRAFLLEDDFSYHKRNHRIWRVEAVDLQENTLTVIGVGRDGDEGEEQGVDAQPTTFDLLPSTRVWKGSGIAALSDIAVGQTIQCNLTWATLYGAGRCTDIWLDEESRLIAADQQRTVHRQHQKERGLAGWIDAVDNQQRIVTVTLFGGVDPELIETFQPETSVTAVVAEPSLRSYDQVNDRKSGPLLEIRSVPKQPGSSGVQIVFQPSLLLEGFRPGRIVRLFPSDWPVISIPLEERLWPARD